MRFQEIEDFQENFPVEHLLVISEHVFEGVPRLFLENLQQITNPLLMLQWFSKVKEKMRSSGLFSPTPLLYLWPEDRTLTAQDLMMDSWALTYSTNLWNMSLNPEMCCY